MQTTRTDFDPVLVEWLERAALLAPRLVERATWDVRLSGGALELVTTRDVRLDQPACASYGMAVEFLVTALHEQGLAGHVVSGPSVEDRVLARIEPASSATPSKIDHALFAALDARPWPALLSLPTAGCPATGYQRHVLALAAASHRTTLEWDVPVTPDALRAAVVTAADSPDDWFRAGRATAHVMLRAHALGLQSRLVTPSLRHTSVREAVRRWLRTGGYPQVLLQVYQATG